MEARPSSAPQGKTPGTWPTPRMVSIPVGAKALGCGQKQLRRELELGNIPGVKIGNRWKISADWVARKLKGEEGNPYDLTVANSGNLMARARPGDTGRAQPISRHLKG